MLKAKEFDFVCTDIRKVVQIAENYHAIVKVILETGLLSDEEIVKACLLAKEAGASFVKTSTGFGPGGADPRHVSLMKKTVGDCMQIKASGGIRDYDTVIAMIEAGADRIGASAGEMCIRDRAKRISFTWFPMKAKTLPCWPQVRHRL